MKFTYILTVNILLSMLLLTGCSSGTSNSESNNSDSNVSTAKIFELQDIRISRVSGTEEKYKIDTFEDESEELNNSDTLEDLLDSLPTIATLSTDFENEETPVELKKGNFYNFNIDFATQKAYSSALGFSLYMHNMDGNSSSPYLLDQGTVDDINETGEYALSIETLIPDDVNLSIGKYVLYLDITGQDIDRSNEKLESFEDMKNLQYIGGFYANLSENDNAKTIDIVDALSEEYIDLPIDMNFKDGYSNDFLGKTTLVIYSTVAGKEALTIRGILEVEGASYELGLLDTEDGLIKEDVVVNIPAFDSNNITGGDRTFSYYLKEADYLSILEKAPDLSVNFDTDGIEAKIVWYVDTSNVEILTNDIEESFLISKYIKNFSLEINATSERESRGLDFLASTGSEYAISKRIQDGINFQTGQLTYKQELSKWKDTAGLKLGNVDAAVDYDSNYVYLFSGDKFYKYNKSEQKIEGSAIKLKTQWPTMEFDSIDAAFRWDDNIYLFKGNKYARHTKSSGAFYTKPNIKSYWDSTLGSFAPFDAVVRGTFGKYADTVFFLKGDKVIHYDFKNDKSYGPYNLAGSDFTYLAEPANLSVKQEGFMEGLTAIASIDSEEKILFKESDSIASALINEGILFKYEANFNKQFGKKSKFAVEMTTDNEAQAKWSVPSANAESASNIYLHVYKHKVNLLELTLEAGLGIAKIHPSLDANTTAGKIKKSVTTHYGAKSSLSVLGLAILESGAIEEEEATEKLQKDEGKKELDKAKEDGEKSKSSLKMPSYEWDEEKVIFTHNFFTETALPLEAEFGIQGKVAIETDYNIVGAGLELTLNTPIATSAFIRGNLSVYAAKIGVEAKINMIETGGEAKVGAGIRINDDNELQLVGAGEVEFYLRLVQGEFNIVGKILGPTFKRRCLFGKCASILNGVGMNSKTWNIYTTPWLYNRKWILLKYEKATTIYDLKDL